jgi:ABC-type glutathione transport system ATPase component
MGELTEAIQPAAAGAATVEVEDLVKRYRKGKTNAVDGISFSVRPGEFFALLGPNGAGKTTTISILTTTLMPPSMPGARRPSRWCSTRRSWTWS